MDHGKPLWRVILFALLALWVPGCGSPQATHTSVPPTATLVAPTDTPRPTRTPSPTRAQAPTRTPRPEQASVAGSTPWRDDFDGALREGWTWLEERPTRWSLSDSPGSLHIVAARDEEWSNVLVRDAPPGDWEISTQVAFTPTTNFGAAMLLAIEDSQNGVLFGRAYCDLAWCAGNAIYFDHIEGGEFVGDNFATRVSSPSLAYLRLRRQGDTFTGFYSQDGKEWTTIGQHTVALRTPRVGLMVRKSDVEIYADFCFFEILDLSGTPPQPRETPTRTRTPAPSGTSTPTRTPTLTRTPTPTPCLPDASFVADITVPDGTALEMGEPFTKTWQMRSGGCAPWSPGSVWVFVSGDRMDAPASVPVPDTSLGDAANLSVGMVAPDESGTYQGIWQLQGPDGARFGDQASVVIVVKERPPRRLSTGTVIREVGARDGRGELAIGNDLDLDAVAVLSQQGGTVMIAVYILNHNNHTITGIPDGSYELYFTVGEDWDEQTARFTRQRRLSRFDDPVPFTTTATTYQVWSVTLHPVAGGTASTETVPEGEFPDLK